MRKSRTIEIQTERLILRRFRKSEAQDLYEVMSDNRVTEYLSWQPVVNIKETKKLIK